MEDIEEELNPNEDDSPCDLDELLPVIGEFGKYQKLLLFFVCLPACIPCGFCAFNQDTPRDYFCKTNSLSNLDTEERKKLSIPYDEVRGTYSKCSRYAIDWEQILMENSSYIAPNSSWPVESCREGWEFNTTEVVSSIVIDFGLVCEKDIYPTLALVALNLGGPIGVYSFGILNDRLGRKVSYFCCLTTLLVGSFLTAVSTNFWTWAFSRVIVGSTVPAVYQIPFIISLEVVGPHYRSFVTVMTCTFYSFGLMMLAVVTYFVRNWIALSWYTSLPFLSYYFYIFVLPESPRWLLAKGKLEDALKILESMAKVNGKQMPFWFREKLHRKVEMAKKRTPEKENLGAFDLCRTPNMRLKTILITLNWFANETVYLGLSYYGPSLGTNQYISFFLSSLVELPSYVICWIAMDKWGRRWPMCILMMLGGLCCIGTVLLPDDAVNETLVLYLISKSMISASFLIIYPFAGELYPTEIRGVGIGFSSYVGGIGLIVIPFITYLGKENLILPLIIMGILIFFGGLVGLRLPETLNQKLPATLDEGELFGKSFGLNDCLSCAIEEMSKSSTQCSMEENMENIHLFKDVTNTQTNPTEKQASLDYVPRKSNRQSMKRLARQASVMDTQKTRDGAMQLTYWF